MAPCADEHGGCGVGAGQTSGRPQQRPTRRTAPLCAWSPTQGEPTQGSGSTSAGVIPPSCGRCLVELAAWKCKLTVSMCKRACTCHNSVSLSLSEDLEILPNFSKTERPKYSPIWGLWHWNWELAFQNGAAGRSTRSSYAWYLQNNIFSWACLTPMF